MRELNQRFPGSVRLFAPCPSPAGRSSTGAARCAPRGLRPIPARIALARHACRLAHALIETQQPFDDGRYLESGTRASGDGWDTHAARRRNLVRRPLALGPPTAHTKACRLDGV